MRCTKLSANSTNIHEIHGAIPARHRCTSCGLSKADSEHTNTEIEKNHRLTVVAAAIGKRCFCSRLSLHVPWFQIISNRFNTVENRMSRLKTHQRSALCRLKLNFKKLEPAGQMALQSKYPIEIRNCIELRTTKSTKFFTSNRVQNQSVFFPLPIACHRGLPPTDLLQARR